ncbi:MAG: NUDIX hydrolase [Thaumarchaeota archaeon]|nr:NUDIX hydrolase [Nitrososphaerota archaeon]
MRTEREYPSRPLVGAGAVVHRGPTVLLLKRKFPPNEGKWAIPGGLVELGESTQLAALREVEEETGLSVELEGLLDVSSDIHSGVHGTPRFHYVLVDYAARAPAGRVELNGESSAFGWFTHSETRRLRMSEGTRQVLDLFFRRLQLESR